MTFGLNYRLLPLGCAFALVAMSLSCAERVQSPVVRPSRPESTEATSSTTNQAADKTDAPRYQTIKIESTLITKHVDVERNVEITESNWTELQSFIAEKKGMVVIVDVWSTACEPCMTEFPHLIALQKKYPDDIVAISFDVDFAGIKKKPVSYYVERVMKFLGEQPVNEVVHRMCTTPADDLFTEIKLDSIPAIYVYGRDGQLAKRFDGSNGQGEGVSYEKQVIPFVDELVK